MSNYEIVQVADSFEFLRTAQAKSVDHVITDPPYSAHVHSNMMSGTTLEKVELGFESLSQHAFARDMVRVAKRWTLSFCAVEDFGAYRDSVDNVDYIDPLPDMWHARIVSRLRGLGLTSDDIAEALQWPLATTEKSKPKPKSYVRSGIWYKPNSMGQLTGDRPAAAYEGLAIMHSPDTKKSWNGRGSYALWASDEPLDMLACNGTRGEKERHPNQKPLALCLDLVAKFTQPGDLILDPFCGSGRIGEAALLLGRRYVGLERDPVWVERAFSRLSSVEFGSLDGVDVIASRACSLVRPSGPAKTKAASDVVGGS